MLDHLEMKMVRIVENPAEANLVLSFLEGEGISAVIKDGEYHRGLGTLPTIIGGSPSIWVEDDLYEKAIKVFAKCTLGRPN
jgi:hypothetical protein